MQALSIDGFRLSPQQKRFLLLNPISNNLQSLAQLAVSIEGNLDLQILASALEDVIRRHEILRTTFQALPEMDLPLQVIGDDRLSPTFNHLDLSHLPPQEQTGQIENLIQSSREVTFDYENGPLLAVTVVKLSLSEHLLIVQLPALCADWRSLQNFMQEVSQGYGARLGEPVSWEDPLQYADIAEWQNELFEGEEAALGQAYWQKQNASGLWGLKLPWRQPSHEPFVFQPQVYPLTLDAQIIEKIGALAQQYDSSIEIWLLAGWQILLWRLTGQSNVTVGVGFDGRHYEELEGAIGLLAKYLPVNGCLEPELPFCDFLARVGKAREEVAQWQDAFRWEELMSGENGGQRDSVPFFPISFEFHDQPAPILAADLFWSLQAQYLGLEPFEVKLSVLRQDDTLVCEFHYDGNLFQVADIQRLAEQFQTLLANAVEAPAQLIGKLNIVSDRERHHLLVELNHLTASDIIESQSDYIHQQFEEQASRFPDAIAVVCDDRRLTYRELNARANQLAHYLQRLGVGPEVIVGLYVERSLELIVGLLGVLKAGGAYLPLDPALPPDRLAFMVQEAKPRVLLTQPSLREQGFALTLHRSDTLTTESVHSPTVVCFDRDEDAIAQESPHNLSYQTQPEHLAYVIYTSGSTGTPKGVLVEHRQLRTYCEHIQAILNLPIGTNFAFVSTFAADLGNTMLFPSLCGGGCLHVISQDRAADPDALGAYFQQHAIDCLKIVPSHLQALLAASQPGQVLPRQRLILGGEVLNWALVEKIQTLAPNCQILNHYGPTETTVGVLTYAVGRQKTSQNSATVPVGAPLPEVQVYVLDGQRNLVPYGVPGELYIGGKTVARGYLNRDELTSTRFIANPFLSSGQLYQTGDRVRYLPDGNLEFLGRVDRQVKIRGYRIELGEIESILLQHPTVQETVVLAREDGSAHQSLVAYLVFKPDAKPATSELRQFLRETLPEYMVPGGLVPLKALPLTANGKIDRQNLPAPDTVQLDREQAFIAPRNDKETILAQIWGQTLNCDHIGIHDNFFDLGGDSILGMQIIARANQSGLRLTPRQIFEYQTIAELAAVAGMEKTLSAEQSEVTGSVPLTPIQKWFFAQELSDPHHWNQTRLLEVHQTLDPTLLAAAIRQLLKHHDALRLRFRREQENWQAFNPPSEATVPFTQQDLSQLSSSEQQSALKAAATQAQTSLNLSAGPLLQVVLFAMGPQRSDRLLITIHHLAVDGVSWRILLTDLHRAYQQLAQGQTVQLPTKTTSFKRWAQQLQSHAQSVILPQELSYWQALSRQSISTIPIDVSDGNNTVAEAQTVSVTLDRALTQALLQEVPAAYQTQINDVLLTALVLALAGWIGDRKLLIDLEGHGREDLFDALDVSRTVGWFTTIFPVLFDLSQLSESGECLQAVKQQLQAIPNRGIGYGILRYLGNAENQLASIPQAQLRFNYLGQSDQLLSELSGFSPASEAIGPSRSPRDNRPYLLDINCIIIQGQLQLDWIYSQSVHRRETIEQLAERYLQELRSLIIHCQSMAATDKSMTRSQSGTQTVATLRAEAILDKTIRPDLVPSRDKAEPEAIFLTGASGFVGAFLLAELLQQTQADIYCLVRAADTHAARQKLQQNLVTYGLWDDSVSDRIIPAVGDLAQPLLGLSEQTFQSIASQCDRIYHNGAVTNLVYPYAKLKAANVLGTQEILRLASHIYRKPVHYISTVSAVTSEEQAAAKTLAELEALTPHNVPTFGYAQTKWVAEQLIAMAHQRGLSANIYRLGRISGHSQTGVCNTNDRLYRMIKGFVQLGYAPELDVLADMTPVDYVSQAIIHLSGNEQLTNQIFHLYHPQPWRWHKLFEWIRAFGYPLETLSFEQLQAKLRQGNELTPDNPLYPLLPFFTDKIATSTEQTQLFEQTSDLTLTQLSAQNTLEGLSGSRIHCPPVDDQLLSTYFQYLIDSGYLNAPQRSQ